MNSKKMIVAGAAVLLAVLVIVVLFRGGENVVAPEPTEVVPATESRAASHRIDVPYLAQGDRYPCGCESVTAVMALNYAGYTIDTDTFIDDYLPQGTEPYYDDDGQLYADSPYEAFIGSPYSEYSYGCYAPVIKDAVSQVMEEALGEVNAAVDASGKVVDLSGRTLEQLCDDYVSRDIPVILWGTIRMEPVSSRTTWILPDGSEFTWKSREHCLLLVGYDEQYYYFNDPMEGKNTAYRKADVENAYQELYSQALAITAQWLL